MKTLFSRGIFLILISVCILSACSHNTRETTERHTDTPVPVTPPLSAESWIASHVKPLAEANYPKVSVIALGEATHGNKELTDLKKTVFEALMNSHGMRVFALEGDFGGAFRVNEYIHGGEGTSEDAVKAIGFRLYRTEEMLSLIKFMRQYNDSEPDTQKKIRFYGFDMQRFDHNKAILFDLLAKARFPDISSYSQAFEPLNDANREDLKKTEIALALEKITALKGELQKHPSGWGGDISAGDMAVLGHLTEVLRQHLVLRQSGAEYGKIRDQFMAQNALWIREFEGKFFDNTSLFLSAHNGHVMKESVIVGTEKVMGQILSERLQEQYAVIVTDFLESTFFASDMMSQEYQTFSVKNTDTRGLISIFSQAGVSPAFLNISELDTSSHESVLQYLEKRQPITVIGAVFSKILEGFPSQYTQKITPKKAFDAMIFFKNLTPYTKLPSHDEE